AAMEVEEDDVVLAARQLARDKPLCWYAGSFGPLAGDAAEHLALIVGQRIVEKPLIGPGTRAYLDRRRAEGANERLEGERPQRSEGTSGERRCGHSRKRAREMPEEEELRHVIGGRVVLGSVKHFVGSRRRAHSSGTHFPGRSGVRDAWPSS